MDASSSMGKTEPGGYIAKEEQGEKAIHNILVQEKGSIIGVALFSQNIHILQPPSLWRDEYIDIFANKRKTILQSGSNIFGAIQTIRGYFPKHGVKNTILVITDGGNTTTNTAKEKIYTNDISIIILCLSKKEQSTHKSVGCKYIAKETNATLMHLKSDTILSSILTGNTLYQKYILYNIYALILFSLYIGYYIYHKKKRR